MPPLPAPTTTLTKETSVNTSAAPNYCSLQQPIYGGTPRVRIGTSPGTGCPDPNKNEIGNVSRRDMRELLYAGATTKIMFHLMPWWPHTAAQAGYVSNDINQVKKQIQDAKERGAAGFMINYYYTLYDGVSLKIRDECNRRKDFEFSFNFDVGIIKNLAAGTRQARMIQALNYVAATYYPSTQYTKWNGRPLVTFFGFSVYEAELDWPAIKASINGNPLLVFRNLGAYTGNESDGVSDGAYSWTDPASVYAKAKTYPTKLTIGSVAKGFWDDMASWGDAKYTPQNNALFWKSQWDLIKQYFSTNFQLPFLQVVTWNDIEEGTAIEFGVDNHISVGVSLAGDVLNWTVTGGSGETMVSEYKIWMSTDGQNLSRVDVPGSLKPGTNSFDLSTLGLPDGDYKVRVQAEGKPCVFNHISPELTWSAAVTPWPPPPLPANQSSVAAETTNNTSASPDYRADSPDANIRANFAAVTDKSDLSFNPNVGNVSKEPPNVLLPAAGVGYEGMRFIVSTEDWWGTTGHIQNGYVSNSVAQMEAMVQDAKARGYHVLNATWYGGTDGIPNHVAINAAALKLRDACVKFGMKMCLTAGLLIWRGATKDDKANNFNLDLDYANTNFFQSSAYEKFNGRPLLFLFSEDQVLLNTDVTQWNIILGHLAAAGNPRLLSRNSSATTKMYPSGVFAWPSTCDVDSATGAAAYLNFYYQQVSANAPSDWPIVGAAYAGFYDKLASWKFLCANSAERFINRRAAQTWLDTWKAMQTSFGPNKRALDYLMVATWNDYEEGTEIELGIDAGFTIQAAITGTTAKALTWSVNGNLNALAKVKVWLSIDNNNLDLLLYQANPNGSIPIADLALVPGTYEFYVQAVGVNSVRNAMSVPVVHVVLPPVVNPPPIEEIPDPARIICERFRQRLRQADNPTYAAQS